jgi:hypothetical protein
MRVLCSLRSAVTSKKHSKARMQAAQAYDKAARSIRGANAICNFPANEQEEQNTAKYRNRLATSVRKRRHGHAESSNMPTCMLRLTARQRARLESSSHHASSPQDTAAAAAAAKSDVQKDGSRSQAAPTPASHLPPVAASVLATKKMISKGNCRRRILRVSGQDLLLDRSSGSTALASSGAATAACTAHLCRRSCMTRCTLPLRHAYA